jgi:hypothetical protein
MLMSLVLVVYPRLVPGSIIQAMYQRRISMRMRMKENTSTLNQVCPYLTRSIDLLID